jgi:hypothetical protein
VKLLLKWQVCWLLLLLLLLELPACLNLKGFMRHCRQGL